MIGQVLGNYRLVEQIGMGGMATVYKAYDPDTDRYVAIKVLPPQFSEDPTFRQRFEQEAKAIARLEHIHILPIFAYGEQEGIAYMAMRYLPTGTLTDRIKQGPLPLDAAARILAQLADALDYAHSHNILHRDVKPSNVLLDERNNAILTDFGIAKMVEATLDLTGGGILGTPAYMSPEQCRGSKELTPASDIYSLGIVLYEMVTGRTPFQAETPIALIHKQLNEPLPIPRQLRPDLPEAAQQVIFKALAKEPESRYETCEAMAQAFNRAVAQAEAAPPAEDKDMTLISAPARVQEPTAAQVAGETVGPPPRRRRVPLWAWGLVGLLVLACGLGTLFALNRIRAGREARLGQAVPPVGEAGSPIVPAGSEVMPCEWTGHGSGLCVYLPGWEEEEAPLPIFEEAGLEPDGLVSWSPDGRRIAFAGADPAGEEGTALYTLNTDGSDLAPLPQVGENDVNPAWSPDGEWLVFHSDCDLAVMRADGSDAEIIWDSPGEECTWWPQWSPDSSRVVVSVMPLGVEGLSSSPTRHIWLISPGEGEAEPLIAVEHEPGGCLDPEVAFGPEGQYIAYTDNECRSWAVNIANPDLAVSLETFPWTWTGRFFPQWGRGPYMAFTDSFEREEMVQHQWVMKADDHGHSLLEVRQEQMQLEVTNDTGEPWGGSLQARLAAPVMNIGFEIGLLEADGERVGFGVNFVEIENDIIKGVMVGRGGHVLIKDGDNIQIVQEADGSLPVHYEIFLEWLPDNEVVVVVDGQPVGAIPVRNLAREVAFSIYVGEAASFRGYLDNVRMEYVPSPEITVEPEVAEMVEPPPELELSGQAEAFKALEECGEESAPQICVHDYGQDEVTQITYDLEFPEMGLGVWSPDGGWIVFEAGFPDNHDLYIVGAGGSDLWQLTEGDAYDSAPIWSPDGELIAFNRNCDLWTIRPDGSEAQMILPGGELFCPVGMSWSPDSQQLAFLNYSLETEETLPDIWLIDRAGSRPEKLYTLEQSLNGWALTWSPDGELIAYWFQEGGQDKAALIPVDGSRGPIFLEDEERQPWLWLPNIWPRWGEPQE